VIHVDSSFLIDLMREQHRRTLGPATAFLETHEADALGASVFVACELEAGAAGAANPDRERARLRALFQAVQILYPDERFAPTYGDLLGRILSSGRSVSTMDLLIATSAVMDGAPLVTANKKHFSVVPDLSVISY
jgi:tRNA(fMet)-specific endonuclease VapC